MNSQSSQKQSAAGRYQMLWDRNANPELDAFLRQFDSLQSDELSEVLRVDMRQRWKAGQPLQSPLYLERFPQLQANLDAALDLIYSEYLLREERGELPNDPGFAESFPKYAPLLQQQIELHNLVEQTASNHASPTLTEDPSEPTPFSSRRSEDELPTQFGRYEIIRLIGRGGMGSVYLAKDTVLHRQVAMKVPKTAFADDDEALKRFYREARTAARMQHPNICSVFDVGQHDGRHYLTMAFIDGETLYDRIKKLGPMPMQQAVDIMLPVLDAIQYAHQQGILHRDLKPSNIMLDDKGSPQVLDFGLARWSSAEESQITGKGDFIGTAAFASPEQIQGDTSRMGPASDIYSLGSILFQLLTGQPPFTGNFAMVAKQIIDTPPPKASSIQSQVPAWLDAVCDKALAKNPQNRFESADAFASALRSSQHAMLVSEVIQPNGGTNPIARERKPNWLIPTFALLACALVAASVWMVWSNSPKTTPVSEQETSILEKILPEGSAWSGEFSFASDPGKLAAVELRVLERRDAYIRALYRTEGRFEREVAGNVSEQEFELKFVAAKQLMGTEHLIETGSLKILPGQDSLTVNFFDSQDGSTARFRLNRD